MTTMMMMMRMFQSELLAEVYHQNYEPVTSLAVDESGSVVISGDQKGYLNLWNIASSRRLREPCCHKVKEVSALYYPHTAVEHKASIFLG